MPSFHYTLVRIDENDNEISLPGIIEYDVEPAQRGGRDDPSWDAYPYGAVFTLKDGTCPPTSKEEDKEIEEAMQHHFDGDVDFPEPDVDDSDDPRADFLYDPPSLNRSAD